MSDVLKAIGAFIGVVIILPVLFIIMMIPLLPLVATDCANLEKNTGASTKWDIIGGCYVKNTNGDWVTRDKWENNTDKIEVK